MIKNRNQDLFGVDTDQKIQFRFSFMVIHTQ